MAVVLGNVKRARLRFKFEWGGILALLLCLLWVHGKLQVHQLAAAFGAMVGGAAALFCILQIVLLISVARAERHSQMQLWEKSKRATMPIVLLGSSGPAFEASFATFSRPQFAWRRVLLSSAVHAVDAGLVVMGGILLFGDQSLWVHGLVMILCGGGAMRLKTYKEVEETALIDYTEDSQQESISSAA